MGTMAKLYEISALAKSGREGEVVTSDDNLRLHLGSPSANIRELYNPEQLFACGYASCFSQAMFSVAQKNKIEMKTAPIKVTVQLHQDEDGYFFRIGIEATIDDLEQSVCIDLMNKTHQVCPFSKLIKPENLLFLKVNGEEITL